MNKVEEIIKVADIHADKIRSSFDQLKNIFPLNEDKASNIEDQDQLLIERLVNRFGKLQDLVGSKLINEFLVLKREYADKLSMIDKLNKLERLEIIESVGLWDDMRKVRNQIAHEYPDEPALMAKYLNQVYDLTPKLLDIYNNLKERLNEGIEG